MSEMGQEPTLSGRPRVLPVCGRSRDHRGSTIAWWNRYVERHFRTHASQQM